MKLYDQLLSILTKLGVKQIFGVPGDAINPLIEALRKQDHIEFIHVAHEESAAFAASAQAKLTGRLAVCVGTVGPGAIHLLNGLYDAKKDHAPVLAITGQVPKEEIGFEYHQEVDLDTLFNDVAVYQQSIYTPKQMPRAAITACESSLAFRGVSVLTIPHDVGNKDVKDVPLIVNEGINYTISPDDVKLNEALKKIESVDKITILYGEGCRGCKDELLKLSNLLSAPLVYSLKGKDIIPYDSDLVAGNIGLLGTRGGVAAIENCDLLLVLGSDFPYKNWYPKDTPIIHVDINPAVFGRRVPCDLGLVGHCKNVISAFLSKLKAKTDTAHLDKARKAKQLWNKGMEHLADIERSNDMIHPQAAAKMISSLANDQAIFTCDTGAVTVWAARHLKLKQNQRFSCSFNLASMAYALPASIGAQMAYSDRQVISLSGDGGFNMLMGDFLTAVKYKLPIKIFVFNNHKLGLIKMEQEVEGFPEHETDLQNPDYALLAKSFGASGASVKDPDKLEEAIKNALNAKGPYLLDIWVNPNELTIPPKLEFAQAWGFGKSKIKEVFNHFFDNG